MDGEVHDKLRIGHSMGLAVSLRRMKEVLLALPVSYCNEDATSAIMAEVVKMTEGFSIMSRICADEVVKQVEEVKVLRKEKQLLENKLEQMASAMSSMVSGKTTVLKDANVDLTTPEFKSDEQIKNQKKFSDGHMQLSLHLKCEEELVKQEVELAKLRKAYTGRTYDLQDCRKEVIRVETLTKKAEIQAEKERLELVKTHTHEITDLKTEVVRLKEEASQRRKEAGRLEEQLGKATLKNEQFVELLKKDSKQQEELRRQQITLKGYLQLLASKFTSTQESEDLQFELKGLECRGFDDDIKAYLKIILERSFKPAKCSVRTQTQTMSTDMSESSRYSTPTGGTQTSGDCLSALQRVGPWSLLIEEPPVIEETNVLDHPWNLNFAPDEVEVKRPQDLDDERHDEVMRCPVSTEEPLLDNVQNKCLSHAGTKRPVEVIYLGSDSEDESEKRQANFRQKYRQRSPWLERGDDALDINIPLCQPSSPEVPM